MEMHVLCRTMAVKWDLSVALPENLLRQGEWYLWKLKNHRRVLRRTALFAVEGGTSSQRLCGGARFL